jgi:hypothetical protein
VRHSGMDQGDIADLIYRDVEQTSRRMTERRDEIIAAAMAAGLRPEFGPVRSETDDQFRLTISQDVTFHRDGDGLGLAAAGE